MKLKCGHRERRSFAEAHQGLCRKCHSSFNFLLDLEHEYGEDALVEYWYGMILAKISDNSCIVDHLIDFYECKMAEMPWKQSYIGKMLFMLRSIKDPFKPEQMI